MIRPTLFLALLSLVISTSLVTSCGDAPVENARNDQAGMTLTLTFPEGFAVDKQSGALSGPACVECNAAPAYVTGVTLIVGSTETGEITEYVVPLETGEVEGAVPPGEYVFAVEVKTNLGYTFTGTALLTLIGGTTNTVDIDLFINAAPTILSMTVSNSKPALNEVVTITASVTDYDGDPLTYTWGASGGTVGSTNGATATWSGVKSGIYKVWVMVSDHFGGTVTGTVTLTIPTIGIPVVTASAFNTEVTLVWDPIPNATSYKVYRGMTPGVTVTSGTLLTGTATLDPNGQYLYLDAGLTPSTTYYYIVTAITPTGESDPSLEVFATTIPATPTGLNCVGGFGKVPLNWTGDPAATTYNVYWSTVTGVTITNTALAATGSTYTHTGRAQGRWYYYAITAVNAAGESPITTEVVCQEQTGVTWTLTGGAATAGTGVMWGNGRWVSWGGLNTWTSTDGATWTGPYSVNFNPILVGTSEVVWSGTQYVTGGHGGGFSVSPDGATWVYRGQLFAGNTIFRLCSNGANMVLATQDSSKRAVSTNGGTTFSTPIVTWAGGWGNWMRMCHFGNGVWVMGTHWGNFATSANATTWTLHDNVISDRSGYLTAASMPPSTIVIAGEIQGGPSAIMKTSVDNGTTWTPVTLTYPGDMTRMVHTGSRFVANGSAGVAMSTDGFNWDAPFATPVPFSDIAWNGTKFTAVATDGSVYSSP